jgi:hypothetical protein
MLCCDGSKKTRRPKNKPQDDNSGDHDKNPSHGADYNINFSKEVNIENR